MKENIDAYLIDFLERKGFNTASYASESIQQFITDHEIEEKFTSILNIQKTIMEKWEINSKIIDFKNLNLLIPNASYGVLYEFLFEENFFTKHHLQTINIEGLDEIGLVFNADELSIKGKPLKSGDFKVKITYKVIGENDTSVANEKNINLVINPDPKSLWKNIPSDKEAIFWKEDNDFFHNQLGDKSIISHSKRGRSHQNVGSFRDDHSSCKFFERTKWSVVAVSDGAGSAPLSREGSKIACDAVIDYLESHITAREILSFEKEISHYSDTKDEERWAKVKIEATKATYKAITHAHNTIHTKAAEILEEKPEIFNQKKYKYPAEYFHATLIVTIFKKFDIGYVLLTFSVGDCPIGIVNKDKTKATLLNWLDVGEFGGGTRFITQPEIFHSKDMFSRFTVQIEPDFSYLFLMSDGIYDAKFEVEANLDKTEKWLEFIEDLEGKNEAAVALDFNAPLSETSEKLGEWMDFWSKGNHDDRTLSIIY